MAGWSVPPGGKLQDKRIWPQVEHLDWILGKACSAKGLCSHGTGGAIFPAGICKMCGCGTCGHVLALGMAVLMDHLDLMILKVLAYLSNSIILRCFVVR